MTTQNGFRVPATTELESRGVRLSETVHAGSVRHARHVHAHAYFDIVLSGAHVERFRGGMLELARGSVAYRPAGWEHSNEIAAAGTRCFNVEMGGRWVQDRHASDMLPDCPSAFANVRLRDVMMRLWGELREPDEFSPLAVDGISFELVAQLHRSRRAQRNTPSWLATVMELIHDGGITAPTLTELSAVAGVHPAHLARTFRKHTGCSVGEAVRADRLQRAVERINKSADPISTIALDCGFYDQAHLTRIMQRRLGVTPARLRRESQGAARPKSS